jgi:hypothetical protein
MKAQRPKSFPKKPEDFADAFSSSVHAHHWLAGTPALTAATCWPQPAQVVLPQFLQETGRHMMVLL